MLTRAAIAHEACVLRATLVHRIARLEDLRDQYGLLAHITLVNDVPLLEERAFYVDLLRQVDTLLATLLERSPMWKEP